MAHFADSGFTSIRNMNEVDEFYPYDIYCEYNGKKIAIEVKQRTHGSDTYDDALFRKEKYDRIMVQAKKDKIDQTYIIQIYTDGIFEIFRIEDYTKTEKRYYQHTEHFDNKEKEEQIIYLYPHNKQKQRIY